MDKKEIIKIILINEISQVIDNDYPSYHGEFMRPQEDLMDTIPEAIGESVIDTAIDTLIDAVTYKEGFDSLYEQEEVDEKDIAFSLLEFENDCSNKLKALMEYDQIPFFNIACELVNNYLQLKKRPIVH
jgi:hypothetical protein